MQPALQQHRPCCTAPLSAEQHGPEPLSPHHVYTFSLALRTNWEPTHGSPTSFTSSKPPEKCSSSLKMPERAPAEVISVARSKSLAHDRPALTPAPSPLPSQTRPLPTHALACVSQRVQAPQPCLAGRLENSRIAMPRGHADVEEGALPQRGSPTGGPSPDRPEREGKQRGDSVLSRLPSTMLPTLSKGAPPATPPTARHVGLRGPGAAPRRGGGNSSASGVSPSKLSRTGRQDWSSCMSEEFWK